MRIVLIFAIIFIGGCSANPIVLVDTTKIVAVNFPDAGTIHQAGLGQRVAARGVHRTTLALEVLKPATFDKKEGEASLWTCGLTTAPSTAAQRGVYNKVQKGQQITANCFGPFYASSTDASGVVTSNCRGETAMVDICHNNVDQSYFMVYPPSPTGKVVLPLEQDFDHFRSMEMIVESDANFLSEFIYGGRYEEKVKFVYREFSNNNRRPDFTQEVEYDLSKSLEIRFRDLRIEIIEATNSEIKYKLLRNFSDPLSPKQ